VKLQQFQLNTTHFGIIKILRPVPTETRQGDHMLVDPWGVLAPLRSSPEFARLIPVVDGETFSHALHGRHKPLVEALGPEPKHLLKLVPPAFRECVIRADCIMYDPRRCVPSKKLMECWQCEGVEEDALRAAANVALAWAEGRYVVVVEGDEFNLGGVGV
jgi:hypothetical protein